MTKFTSTEFLTTHGLLVTDALKVDGLFEKMLIKFNKEFTSGGFTNEQIAMARSQFFASVYQTIESQTSANTLEILKSGIDEELKIQDILAAKAKVKLIDRERYGFDDNLKIKQAEFNGSVASFSINVDSTSKQDAIDRFNASIASITNGTCYSLAFGEIVINDIVSTDVLVTGIVNSEFSASTTSITITANAVDVIGVVDALGNFSVTVDPINLIVGETVTATTTLTDGDGNTSIIFEGKVVT